MVHSDSSWFMVDSSWKNLKLPHPLSAAGEERVDQRSEVGVSKRNAIIIYRLFYPHPASP